MNVPIFQDDVIDVFPLAFMNVFFGAGGLPEINMANVSNHPCHLNSATLIQSMYIQTCNNVDDPVFAGSGLANCQFMASDIQACQAKGKIITLSLGGATGAATFSSDAQAESFADLVWNTFLGGSSSTRPFGNAVSFSQGSTNRSTSDCLSLGFGRVRNIHATQACASVDGIVIFAESIWTLKAAEVMVSQRL